MIPITPGWEPRSEAQFEALRSPAEILLFGGAAGSLKSETMLVDAAAERERASLRAILLRRSFPELERSLIRRSRELYAEAGATYNESRRCWTFPSGATVEFGYCESDDDVHRYQGAEFSFIGFDESTYFSEFPIRFMLSRLRSTDPGLRLRMRLASNPGNVGHQLHKSVFLGGHCPHCHPHLAKIPGKSYTDAVWPSDSRPIGLRTAFIPGRVTDHSLLGPRYIQQLESLGGAFRKALLEGCWSVYQGQYFDNWRPAEMIVPRASIHVDPKWPHWIGIDYGFNVSQAAAYLLCKTPASVDFSQGRTYVLDEFTVRHCPAADFAQMLRQRWYQSYLRIVASYLSPDAWSDRGENHSLADQMQNASGLCFERAANDRIGGAMLLYSLLDRGAMLISDSCRQLIDAMPTRIHDPARPDDILKISGDPLDDCIDALRYAAYSYVDPPAAPEEFEFSSDPTIANIQHMLVQERWEERTRPFRYLPWRERWKR